MSRRDEVREGYAVSAEFLSNRGSNDFVRAQVQEVAMLFQISETLAMMYDLMVSKKEAENDT